MLTNGEDSLFLCPLLQILAGMEEGNLVEALVGEVGEGEVEEGEDGTEGVEPVGGEPVDAVIAFQLRLAEFLLVGKAVLVEGVKEDVRLEVSLGELSVEHLEDGKVVGTCAVDAVETIDGQDVGAVG